MYFLIHLNSLNSHKVKLHMFKSPVRRSDWLATVTSAPVLRHATSGRKVSRAGRGATQKLEESTNRRRGQSQHRPTIGRVTCQIQSGGRVLSGCRIVVISVWLQSRHRSVGRLFAARALWEY